MCKYYAYHITCPEEKKNGKCDYLHNHNIRAVHDIMNLNRNIQMPKEEIREKLVYGYNASISDHRREVNWKEDALNAYPQKPSYRERKKNDYTKHRTKMLKQYYESKKEKIYRKIEIEDETL